MKTSEKGLDLIKCFESFRPVAYKCPAGVWSVGYGSTKGVSKNMTVTHEQAIKMLLDDVAMVENAISKNIHVEINQNQFDALVSFVYNVGIGAFLKSTLLKAINNNDFALAASQFDRWIYAGGIILRGLKTRREAEKQLFIIPTPSEMLKTEIH